jgi:DNA-binding IclR family transcriptional regulator
MEFDVNQLTTNDVVKLDIIQLLSTHDDKLSVTSIAKQLGYKYETVRTALSFLLICNILSLF